ELILSGVNRKEFRSLPTHIRTRLRLRRDEAGRRSRGVDQSQSLTPETCQPDTSLVPSKSSGIPGMQLNAAMPTNCEIPSDSGGHWLQRGNLHPAFGFPASSSVALRDF